MNKILSISILCIALASGSRLTENDPTVLEMSRVVDRMDFRENISNVLDNDVEMADVLRQYNDDAKEYCNNLVVAQWNVAIDLRNEEYALQLASQIIEYAEFRKDEFDKHFKDVNYEDYDDESNRRQLRYLTKLGTNILPNDQLNELAETNSEMDKIYSTAKMCPFNNQECLDTEKLSLDPEIEHIMATSKDFEELKYVWQQWHDNTGPGIRSYYGKFMSISNEAALLNSFEDTGAMWRFDYEDENLKANMLKLWDEVEPLYDLLHTYVRYRLIEEYGLDKMDASSNLIPAHLLGNMWGQSWVNLYERFKPFDAADIDVTNKMVEQDYSADKMFKTANEFYMNLTLDDATMSFTGNAVIEKIEGQDMVCHASAWDFCDGGDFRIKQCTVVNMVDFMTVFHELGHIQYYIQYADQPLTFRSGANPGFHEAVGDLMALSASTPKYLSKIGLLESYEPSYENDINSLFKMALERVAFLPFGLLIDMYRWDLFDGSIPETRWNEHWEDMREKYQKVQSPVQRNEAHFDAGAKFHVASGYQYINYFFAHILEFQLHEAMCKIAGEYDPNDKENKPLHRCSIDGSADVGLKLKAGLSMGLSKHWSEALEVMTGQRELLASSIKEYFEPLTIFLEEEIEKFRAIERDNEIREILATYNDDAKEHCNNLVVAQWNVAIDLRNEEYALQLASQIIEYAEFRKDEFDKHFKDVNYEDYDDESNRRQLRYLTKLGTNILPNDQLNELAETNSEMDKIYSTAKMCPFNNQECLDTEKLSLDPEIEHIMATSKDFEELKYVWQQWHDNTGPGIRSYYGKFMSISNEAALLNSFEDTGAMWRFDYEDENLKANMLKLWDEVEPLYDLLHTYVRYRLIEEYGLDKMDASSNLIPAHLLGNMWGQSWVNLYERFKPFDAADIDVTNKMVKQDYSADKMFKTANEFYMNLTLDDATMSFTGNAVIEKIEGQDMVCHASAWDFCDGGDFRIKQCTVVNMVDFMTVFHELGHIQYYIQYADQPLTFRSGANPGFHEAVGDLMALSASTPKYLSKIGLLESYEPSYENDINSLFKMALERVAFLPFGLLIDMYRWDLFDGSVPETRWNEHWEDMREKYQKVQSPVQRNEGHFDAGAKFHVASGYQYINYFFAHILEFQLHEAMCKIAGEYDPNDKENKPLHRCSIDGSADVGLKLKAGLSMGLSKHWSEALEVMTGQRELLASSIKAYFEPLTEFLKTEINKWPSTPIQRDIQMRGVIMNYNVNAAKYYQDVVAAEWEVAINLSNKENQDRLSEMSLANARFRKDEYVNHFANIDVNDYSDEYNRRQLIYLTKLGTNILAEDKLRVLIVANSEMEIIYSTAKICPFNNQDCDATDKLSLDPEVEEIMATSQDFDELKYVWQQWHDNTGPGIRQFYGTFMNISNEAAVQNSFADTGDMWRHEYEDPKLREKMLILWEKVEPLYLELHTYVRRKLLDLYGSDKINVNDKLIPAHLLGNMWAQSWVNLYDRLRPFKNTIDIDVTNKMVELEYTAVEMFKTANEFYMNLTLDNATMSFTGDAVIEKIEGQDMVCHASAWDFGNSKDFRIKQCTVVSMVDFMTVFHEMGHIQYFIQYADQPLIFRSGANPGFHEAVGDLMALSASTPKYLSKIGLLTGYEDSYENDINFLFKMALERVAFLPFGLLIDMYRWDLFDGSVPENEWNEHWEDMREKYQKVRSPVSRTEEHFDAGAKFHVASGYQYINYFFAHILEFQLHEAMCKVAGEYDPNDKENKPLHRCSIDGSAEVGSKLKAGLSMGLSKHWSEALEVMTGQDELSESAILEYFNPLYEFLLIENRNYYKDLELPLVPIIVGAVLGIGFISAAIGAYIYSLHKRRRLINESFTHP